MGYEPVEGDPAPEAVRRVTFVPFLPDGRCAAIPGEGGARLPGGEVLEGEHWLLDTALRVPLETAGFRVQRVHPFAFDAGEGRVYAWADGEGGYRGRRAHAVVELVAAAAEELAGLMAVAGDRRVVLDAARSYRSQSDDSYFADNVRHLEPAYLRAATAEGGSGFGGSPEEWRERRLGVVAGVHRDGTFLDVGCANGLLMESAREWAAERGLRIEPYGVDLAPGLVKLARRRLPHWAGRIHVGNALRWTPEDGRRFTFVHVLADSVPRRRFGDLVAHVRGLVEPGGRLLVSDYGGPAEPSAAERLTKLGIPVVGASATTAWVDA